MHDQTGRTRPGRPRHLAVIPAGPHPPPFALPAYSAPAVGRVRLALWQRQVAEHARQLADQLAEADAADMTPGQAAFNLGRMCGAALNLLDIIDAITEP
jgi:hypothetical protein